jgi:hypothetical protein
MDDRAVREMLGKRKDRTIAIILSFKEENYDQFVPEEVARNFRKVILDQLNDLYDFSLDLLRSVEGGSVTINEEYVARLHDALEKAEGLVNG